jgi:hypothetical protein
VQIEWTPSRATHIGTRSSRYPGAADIAVSWAAEAAVDPAALVADPDPRSHTGAIRIVGFSPSAGFVITVISRRIDDQLWGRHAGLPQFMGT